MTQFDDRWEDPVRAEMFSPTDEQVESILDQANRQPISAKTPRRKLVTAAAILAFTIIGCAVGIRSLETIWGERVLSPGYSGRQDAAAGANEGAQPEAMYAQTPQSMEGDASEPTNPVAEMQAIKPSAAASAAPVETRDEEKTSAASGASSASSASGGSAAVEMELTYAPTVQALCATADIVVAGNFEGGVLQVEEELKGESPVQITIAEASALKGWAVVFLEESEGGITFSEEPYLLRVENGQLVARDASGVPMTQFNLANSSLTIEGLRAICAEEAANAQP